MADLKWKVENALNRDVERQHLNKILADISSQFTALEQKVTGPGSSIGNIKDIVGEMVEGNTENGISVTYNLADKVLDFVISSFVITLSGDVTGEGIVSSNSNVTIPVTIDPQLVGIGDAPVDSNAYWRRTGAWELVGPNLEQLQMLLGQGFATRNSAGLWSIREFEAEAGELVVTNPDGAAGNVLYGLADLADSGVGAALIKITRDAKGRVEGTEPAVLDDLDDVDTTGVVLNDVLTFDGTNWIAAPAASGSGIVETIVPGTGIDVDDTDPANPIVALDSASIASLALADSAVQTVTAGTVNVTVDDTDPQNLIISVAASSSTISIEASANLSAGDFIRIHDSSGAKVRPADNTTALADDRADGFVLAGVLSGNMADVYIAPAVNDQLSGLVPGTIYVLSTAGDVIDLASLPAVSGTILQVLGIAISATELAVNIDEPILRG